MHAYPLKTLVIEYRYAPAIRELFASVIVENEDHAQGVLATLSADKRTDGALALTVRRLCLVVGDEADRKAPPPPRVPLANLAVPPLPPHPVGPNHQAGQGNVPADGGLGHGYFNNHGAFGHTAAILGVGGGGGTINYHPQMPLSTLHQINNPPNGFNYIPHIPAHPPLPQAHNPTSVNPVAPAPATTTTTATAEAADAWLSSDDESEDEADVTPSPPPPAAPSALPVMPALSAAAATAAPSDEWALELPTFTHQGNMFNTVLQGQGPQIPHRSIEELQECKDEDSDAEEQVKPLLLSSALDILSQTNCIQALTIRLPTADLLDERTLLTLCSLRLLRKLDIAGKLDFMQLWRLLKNLLCLEDLTVSGVSSGTLANADILQEQFESTNLHLHSLSMYRTELDTELLHGILHSCGTNITRLKLSRFVTSSRLRFKRILQMIGPSLRQLALERLVFRGALPTAAEAHLVHLLDDLPTYSPMLEELQIAAERIISPINFFSTVLPSLFLTQLELDFYCPMITEEQIMELIANLPKGRMEVLSFGSKLKHLSTPKIQRACQEIGIVVLGAGDM